MNLASHHYVFRRRANVAVICWLAHLTVTWLHYLRYDKRGRNNQPHGKHTNIRFKPQTLLTNFTYSTSSIFNTNYESISWNGFTSVGFVRKRYCFYLEHFFNFSLNTAEITIPQIFLKKNKRNNSWRVRFKNKIVDLEFKRNFGNQTATYHMGRTRADIAIKRRGESSLRTKVFIYLFNTRIHWRINIIKKITALKCTSDY